MSQPKVYDFTLKAEGISHTDIITQLYPEYIKKYAFQLEEGDEGYKHYQGRISLIKQRRVGEARKLLQSIFDNIHISPSSSNSLKEDQDFYVIKADTRIDGPWKDTDEKPIYVPRQIREINKLHKWQEQVIEISKQWDTRTINVILDTTGNIGKSTLVSYMGVHRLGRQLPFCNDYKDVLRMVMDMPTSNCYLIDMPRAINKEKLFQLYAAIETVKSGYAYDDRYSFKEKYFDCPQIFIFSNKEPDFNLLSSDRWKIWNIRENQLKEYEHLEHLFEV